MKVIIRGRALPETHDQAKLNLLLERLKGGGLSQAWVLGVGFGSPALAR